MVDRERMLRVVAVTETHAECVVECDNKPGMAGRTARPLALKRFTTSAFRLIENAVDDADQVLYARFLAGDDGRAGHQPVARGVRGRGSARAPRAHRRGGEGPPLTGPAKRACPVAARPGSEKAGRADDSRLRGHSNEYGRGAGKKW